MKKRLAILLFVLLVAACSGTSQDKSAKFLQKGNTLFQQEKYTKAILEYKNALQADPANVEAHLKLAETYLKLDDPRNAFFTYKHAESLAPENLEAKLKLASFYFLMKKYDEARKNVDWVLKKEPLNTEALMLQAGLLIEDKDLDEAEFILRRIIRQEEENTRAYLTLSQLLAVRGKQNEAERILLQGLKTDPGATNLKLALFNLYLQKGEADKARDYLQELITSNPEDVSIALAHANFRLHQNEPGEAEKILKKVLEKHPENLQIFSTLSRLYEVTNQREKLITLYKEAHAQLPKDPERTLALAKKLLQLGELDEAEQYVRQVLEKHPDQLSARLLETEILIARREFAQAKTKLDKLLEEIPASFADASYNKAVALLGLGDLPTATQLLEGVLEKRPDHRKTQSLLGKIYLRNREYQKAIDLGKKTLLRDPKNTDALKMIGASAILLDQTEKARQVFEKLIHLEPDKVDGYHALGLLYLKLKEPVKAIENFEKVLEINPARTDILQKLVLIHMAKKEQQEALQLCNTYLEKVKNNPRAIAAIQSLKGQVYLAMNELDKAESLFKEAIQTAPDMQDGYFLLARLNMVRYGQDKAIKNMEEQVKDNPEQPISRLLLANMYDLRGEYDKSEPHYRKIIELRPGFVPALNNLAYGFAEREKNLDEALKYAEKARARLGDNVQVLDTIGWIQTKMGKTDKAIVNLQKSLEQVPDNPSILYHLGIAYLKAGEREKAKAELEKALASGQPFPEKGRVAEVLSKL